MGTTGCGSQPFDLAWEPQIVVPNLSILIGNHRLWFPTFWSWLRNYQSWKIRIKIRTFFNMLQKKGNAQKNLIRTAFIVFLRKIWNMLLSQGKIVEYCCVLLWIVMNCCILLCIVAHCCYIVVIMLCIVVCGCVLLCIVVYCCVLLSIVVYCCVLLCIIVYCCVLLCIVVYCCVLFCIAVYCCVL